MLELVYDSKLPSIGKTPITGAKRYEIWVRRQEGEPYRYAVTVASAEEAQVCVNYTRKTCPTACVCVHTIEAPVLP